MRQVGSKESQYSNILGTKAMHTTQCVEGEQPTAPAVRESHAQDENPRLAQVERLHARTVPTSWQLT